MFVQNLLANKRKGEIKEVMVTQPMIGKPKFVRERAFYKSLFALAVPVILQNIVVFLTQMLDTVMLGELGDVAMTASSLANQPFFIFNMLTLGLGSGAVVLTAQYWGKKETEPIRIILTMIVRLTMLVGLLLTIVSLLIPEQLMMIFSPDPDVIREGASYMRIMCICYAFFGFSSSFYTTLRSVETVKIAVVSNVAALVVNGGLNYILIFGKLGLPALGVRGAAIATLCARLVEFLIAVIYMLFFDKKLKLCMRDFFRFDKQLCLDLVHISSPVVVNEVMWALGTSMQARLLGQLGTQIVTANSIVSVVQQLATVMVFGVAGAAAVLIGKAIGEGNMQEANDRGYTFKWLSVGVGVLVCILILLMRNVAVDFYNVSAEAKNFAYDMMLVTPVVGFFISISAVGIVGILRGGGDTKFSLNAELFALWGVAVPIAYFTAFVLHWPPIIVYCMIKLDEPVKNILIWIRLRGTRWLRDVTR